ncbi:hypothetical protein AVEN_57929-1 [Araneus ventricosus]|uniref:Reverse transcriptase domain-containing protein n=1 Tax=Araneus ventricosus TaxID=182803 RepID=A0A4Y2KGH6_ARAVE|nr:hypothetical protein AVEN_57929-1 [Araneus ventricosus]
MPGTVGSFADEGWKGSAESLRFHQMKTHPSFAHFTGITTEFGLFEFKRLPFGIKKKANSSFQRLMSIVLAGLSELQIGCYIDDVLVASKTVQEHLGRLEIVFQRFRTANFKLKSKAGVLPWPKKDVGNVNWTLQQDSAPAHKTKKTQEWWKAHFPDMMISAEWPPYSPDRNSMDYSVRSILESRACTKPHKSLDSVKKSIRREWDRLKAEYLRPIAENLRLCIAAKGGHFETN